MGAAQVPDIIALYAKLRDDPYYLEDKSSFAETPLHRAASQGRTELALEILRLKLSLGKKMNLDGLSPLDLALHNGHTSTVNRLVTRYPHLIRIQGRGGITPLHYAAKTENIDLLIKFLIECPSSIKDLTVQDETALHIAVINRKLRAFKVLRGWIILSGNIEIFRWRDVEGNTVLHLAALTNQLEVIKLLMTKELDGVINRNATNWAGEKALDILDHLYPTNNDARKLLFDRWDIDDDSSSSQDYLSSSPSRMDLLTKLGAYIHLGLPGDMQNAVLVVIALVATATYQTALGSTTSGDRKHMIVNTIGFSLAIGMCLILTLKNEVLLYLFAYPLAFFLVSYGFLAHGVLDARTIIGAMCPMLLPIILVLKWNHYQFKMPSESRHGSYSIGHVKYLVFSSKYESRRRQYEKKASWIVFK